jgi:uncharacterized membrane protein
VGANESSPGAGAAPVTGPAAGLAPAMERNITALVRRRREADAARGAQDRFADRVTRFTGSMRSVLLHVAVFGSWAVVNTGLVGLEPFDPSYVGLATLASVEAIFLSTFVLISQNRMQAQADERADLDLQVSLLAEHEITRLVGLVTAVADRLGIEEAADPELAELARDVAPERVLDEIARSDGRRD